jgi:citrate synthase
MSVDVRNIGLRNVIVADTLISKIDPQAGQLTYRGYNIRDLADHSTYEEVVYLLLYDRLPKQDELSDLKKKMISFREPPEYVTNYMSDLPFNAPTTNVLQASIPLVDCFDCKEARSKEENRNVALRLIALFPSIITYWHRIKNNLTPVRPSKLDHASNFLYMLTGREPESEVARVFDLCLILHAEHSFNASTFAAREVASTGASVYASVSAAIGALSGELHGGASAKVMKMLEDIGEIDRVEGWIDKKLDLDERIMGIGHAVYRTTDPRARILKEISKRLGMIKGESKWFDITQRVEEYAANEVEKRKGIRLYPNVDLYTPSIYYLLGISEDLFTPIFASARIAGWCAHVIEEKFAEAQAKPVLYRPKARYIGNYCGPKECSYISVDRR